MQKGQIKKVYVKLGPVPLGRKFLLIKEGKQLLMLKALGGGRSVYSIEEKGIACTGTTRSGKRHFQYSIPKFVNSLEVMNNQTLKSDHVTTKNLPPSTGTSTPKPKKGHFAKKSTGNNVKHTLSRLKHASVNSNKHFPVDGSLKKGQSSSPASNDKSDSAEKLKNSHKSELLKTSKAKVSKTDEDIILPKIQSVSVQQNDKLAEKTARKRANDKKQETVPTKISQKDNSAVFENIGKVKNNDQGSVKNSGVTNETVHLEAVKATNANEDNKENFKANEKSKQKHSENQNAELKTSGKVKYPTGFISSKSSIHLNNEQKESNKGDDGRESHNNTNQAVKNNGEGDSPHFSEMSLKKGGETSGSVNMNHPYVKCKDDSKQLPSKEQSTPPKVIQGGEIKRKRASTPTPESSPVKKNVLSMLSRKRHRSASPKVSSSSVQKKVVSRASTPNAKANMESIKLHSKKFEKVRNACKNAMSQRKNTPVKPELKGSSVSKDKIDVSDPAPSSRNLEPVAKKQKISNSNDGHLPKASQTVAVATDSSDDGLTKLMKDFQSAMSSIKKDSSKNKKSVSKYSKLNENISSSSSQLKQKSISNELRCNIDLNILQAEAISSDEDFEPPQEIPEIKTSNLTNSSSPTSGVLTKIKLCPESNKLNITPEKPKNLCSPDNFLVVDQVGFTPKSASPEVRNFSLETSKHSLNSAAPCVSPTGSKSTFDTINDSNIFNDSKVLTKSKEKLDVPEASDQVESTNDSKTLTKDIEDTPEVYNQENKVTASIDKTNNFELTNMADDKSKVTDTKNNTSLKVEPEPTGIKRECDGSEKISNDVKKPKLLSYDVMVSSVVSTYSQTELHLVKKEDKSCEAKETKPDCKDQEVQFSSESYDIDTEEITRIVSAIVESESEEKERLIKALEEQKKNEEKWRTKVDTLCKELEELRQKLAKKEEKTRKQTGVNTVTEISPLPVITSTQASQIEHDQATTSSPLKTTEVLGKSTSTTPDATKDKQSINSITSGTPNQRKPQAKAMVPDASVALCADRHSAPVRTISAPNGITTVPKANADTSTEVIDLTDSEDVNINDKPDAKKTVVHSRLQTTALSSPANSQQKSPVATSTPNTIQTSYRYKPAPFRGQSQQNMVKASLQSALKIQSLHSQPTASAPKIQPLQTSTLQSVQGTIPNRPYNLAVSGLNQQSSAQVVISPSHQVVPPPLQPAPSIAATIYTPSTTQLPMASPISNLSMLVHTRGPAGVLSGVNQQVMQQVRGLTPLQQQQVQNSVIIGELKRGMLTNGIQTFQAQPNLILPGSSQVTTLPIRLPQAMTQAQNTPQNRKAVLERRKEDLTQKYFNETNNPQRRIELCEQIKIVTNDIRKQNEPVQSARIAQTTSAGNQAHRPQAAPPAYSTNMGTIRHLSAPTSQQGVTSGAKQYVTFAPTQTSNTVQRVINGKTWVPETRQNVEISQKINQGNPIQQLQTYSLSQRHPAALPILSSYSPSAGKTVLLPSPSIRISHSPEGVVLSWNISVKKEHPIVKKYFLYAYQVLNTPPSTSHWKRIGEVGALPPPMACTLNQFQPGSTYFLAICAVDVYGRAGEFSKMEEVVIPV